MFPSTSSTLRVGIYGKETAVSGRKVGLWPSGYRGALEASGVQPVMLAQNTGDDSWCDVLDGLCGVVFPSFDSFSAKQGDGESLCLWCQRHRFPILAVDQGLLILNAALGGTNFGDLSREMPEALQHRHPPEPGLRHAINVQPDTLLAELYGEGEIVVNSEHRQAVQRVAQGFIVSGVALDGVTEAIEWSNRDWFGVGVQWQPASASASGLDIQIFRGLVEASQIKPMRRPQKLAMAV